MWHKFNLKTKLIFIGAILLVLGWGMSITATDNIDSATENFSVIATISEISDTDMKVTDAKGSDASGKTEYDLNIEHVDTVQTEAYEAIFLADLKPGDKIIAQGLTNGSTFFIQRIVSFSTPANPEAEKEASTTEATSTDETATSSPADATSTDSIDGTATSTAATSTEESATTSTTTEDLSSTTIEEATATDTATTSSAIETITDAITNAVQDIVDTVTSTTSSE